MTTTVIATHRVKGFHYWPNAPDEVAYLRALHRHEFMFIVGWKVGHDDRQVEYHTAQAWMKSFFVEPQNFGARSCETLCKDMFVSLELAGHPKPSFIECWEDEENGSRVEA
jgi:hypothetical protein